MDTALLFRKRTPLTGDRPSWTTRCKASGKGVVYAMLVKALLSPLEGSALSPYPSLTLGTSLLCR